MHIKIIHLAANLVAICRDADFREKLSQNLLAFVLQQTVQAFDRIDVEGAVVGGSACVVLAKN